MKHINAYTDGSFSMKNKIQGYAVIFKNDENNLIATTAGYIDDPNHQGSTIAEIKAATEALSYAVARGYSHITIHSDSEAVMNHHKKSKMSKHAHLLIYLESLIEVKYVKIKSKASQDAKHVHNLAIQLFRKQTGQRSKMVTPTTNQQKIINTIIQNLNITPPQFKSSWEISAFIDHNIDFALDTGHKNTIIINGTRYLSVNFIAKKEKVTKTAILNRIERHVSSNYDYLNYAGKDWIDQQAYLQIKK